MRAAIKAMVGAAITVAALSAHAEAQLNNWKLVLPNSAGTISGISQLGFNGESYVQNTATDNPYVFTFTDNGIFNITTKNSGIPLFNVGGPTGQLTGDYFGGSGVATVGQNGLYFNGTGELDIYYNPNVTYGAGTVANRDGAATGTLIGRFTQVAGNSGEAVNANGTPDANGTLTLNFMSTYLMPGVWLDSNGQNLMAGWVLGFVTANASEDLAQDPDAATADDATLRETLSGNADALNAPPGQFYVNNGGQLKLQRVPEPASLAIFGTGLLGLAALRRRKSKS